MDQKYLRAVVEAAVRAGVRLGVGAVGETRSLGGKSTFTETHLKVEDVNRVVDEAVEKLS